jgi:hypothetical protein
MRRKKASKIIKMLVKKDEMYRSHSISEEEEDWKDRKKENTLRIVLHRRIIFQLVLEK